VTVDVHIAVEVSVEFKLYFVEVGL